MFVGCFSNEITESSFRQSCYVSILHAQLHFVVLNLSEIENLIYKAQHSLRIAPYDFQLRTCHLTELFFSEHGVHRAGDERERCTQFVADIGEETQFNLRYFLLNGYFLTQLIGSVKLRISDIADDEDNQEINHKCPWGSPK